MSDPSPERPVRVIADNRKARRNYEILDRLEAGIALAGTEVKTLRNGRVSLEEAYVKLGSDGFFLVGAHIDEYVQGNVHNHLPTRDRRLLVRRREAQKWGQKAKEKGLTIIPTRLYFRGKWVKLEIALARGRRTHDKREQIRKREDERAMRGRR